MITEEMSSFNNFFYIGIISIIIIVGLIIFFIKKLNYNFKKIVKSVLVSLLITIVIEIALFIIYMVIGGDIYCIQMLGADCPTKSEIFSAFLPYTASSIFLLTLFIYYLIKFFRRKNKK